MAISKEVFRARDRLAGGGFVGYPPVPGDRPGRAEPGRFDDLSHQVVDEQVLGFVLRVIAAQRVMKGHTVGVYATTLEANAAMRSIVRRDSGESYQEFLTGLAKESRIETQTREQSRRHYDPAQPLLGRSFCGCFLVGGCLDDPEGERVRVLFA